MGRGISLGRIAGIGVRADWSLLVIFVVITLSLATEVFPVSLPGTTAGVDWILALIAAVLFLASLLAHELAHALVARRRGVTVDGITLWLFGGLAQLQGDVATPGDEVRVTGVGPLVTVILTGLFYGLSQLLSAVGAPNEMVVVPLWLALMNGLLAVFNLIPALPLDGGRLLHSLLWRTGRDRSRATVMAARGGIGFGAVLIVFGIIEIVALGQIGGLWSVLIGWFLIGAARAEANRARVGTALAGLRVADVMSPEPLVAAGWMTIDAWIRQAGPEQRHGTFPVRDFDGRVVGVVSLARLAAVPPEQRGAVRVGAVAVGLDAVVRTTPQEPLLDLVRRMGGPAGGHALVFDGDQLVGVLSRSDIGRVVQERQLSARRPPAAQPPRAS